MRISEMKKIKIGDRVALSKHNDATFFTVISKGPGPRLEIQEKQMHRSSVIDISAVQVHYK